jgi:hypothetical protein
VELAPDHSPREISHPRWVQGPTSACSDLAELLQDKIRAWEVVEECSVAITVRRDEKIQVYCFRVSQDTRDDQIVNRNECSYARCRLTRTYS